MCAACLEYIKEKLTIRELESALKETTIDNPDHLKQLMSMIRDSGDDADKLRQKLKNLTQK